MTVWEWSEERCWGSMILNRGTCFSSQTHSRQLEVTHFRQWILVPINIAMHQQNTFDVVIDSQNNYYSCGQLGLYIKRRDFLSLNGLIIIQLFCKEVGNLVESHCGIATGLRAFYVIMEKKQVSAASTRIVVQALCPFIAPIRGDTSHLLLSACVIKKGSIRTGIMAQ